MVRVRLWSYLLWSGLALAGSGAVAAEGPGVRLEGPKVVVKRFPIVFRVSFTGPLDAMRLTMAETRSFAEVSFGSGGTVQTYSKLPAPLVGYMEPYTGEIGGDPLGVGEVRAALVDLNNFQLDEASDYRSLSPGEYEVWVTIVNRDDGTRRVSNRIRLELRDPAEVEEQVLRRIRDSERFEGVWHPRLGLRWSVFLFPTTGLHSFSLEGLSEAALLQLGLHRWISKAYWDPIPEEIAKEIQTPTYLEAERHAVGVVKAVCQGEQDMSAWKEFAQVHPDVGWRLEKGCEESGLDRLWPGPRKAENEEAR